MQQLQISTCKSWGNAAQKAMTYKTPTESDSLLGIQMHFLYYHFELSKFFFTGKGQFQRL